MTENTPPLPRSSSKPVSSEELSYQVIDTVEDVLAVPRRSAGAAKGEPSAGDVTTPGRLTWSKVAVVVVLVACALAARPTRMFAPMVTVLVPRTVQFTPSGEYE